MQIRCGHVKYVLEGIFITYAVITDWLILLGILIGLLFGVVISNITGHH